MDRRVSVLVCPQCGAPLKPPSRFAREATCGFCGTTAQIDPSVVSAARFREALEAWNSPASHGFNAWLTLGGANWAPGPLIARGEVSDVFLARRARWPSERVALKVLREPDDAPLFDHEWEALKQLHAADGAASAFVPEPVVRGVVAGGAHEGKKAMALGWASGFDHSFEDALRAYPRGVEAAVATWAWRRVLEALSFLHRSGFAHGWLIPSHLLVQRGEHGVRLVGFGCANRLGAPLLALSTRYEAFYPRAMRDGKTLSAAADVCMSARCVAWLLGGDAETGEVPPAVPRPLAELVRRAAAEPRDGSSEDAWRLREEVGEAARAAFGPPAFHPLVIPAA